MLPKIFLTCAFCGVFLMQGYSFSTEKCSVFSKITPEVEAKASYFFFASSDMRKVYDGGFEVQANASYPVWKGLNLYGSVGYLEAKGKSLNEHQKTTLWELPVDLGLRPVFKLCQFLQYYVSVGPRYFYVHQHNNSSYVSKNIGRSGVGLFANTGFKIFPIKNLFIDVFGEYSYEKTHFSSSRANVYGRSIQVGGFNFGGGLGYAF